jgi:WD40 repeat protein
VTSATGAFLWDRAWDEEAADEDGFIENIRGRDNSVCCAGEVRCLRFAPGDRILAVVWDRTVTLWGLDQGARRDLSDHDSPVSSIAFSPDGSTLAAVAEDGTATLWDVADGRARERFDWGIGPLFSVAFAPDGQTAAAGGDNGQVVCWDLDS